MLVAVDERAWLIDAVELIDIMAVADHLDMLPVRLRDANSVKLRESEMSKLRAADSLIVSEPE